MARLPGRERPKVASSLRHDLHVLELRRLVKGAQADFARTQTHIHGAQGGYGFAVHRNSNGTRYRIMSQCCVIPMIVLRKSRWTVGIADAHALAAVNVEDAVVHRNQFAAVDGKMRIVEVRRILIRKDDDEGLAERLHLQLLGKR